MLVVQGRADLRCAYGEQGGSLLAMPAWAQTEPPPTPAAVPAAKPRDFVESERLWEGWIFGDLAQLCLVVAPVLWWRWEWAHQIAAMRTGAPQRELSARNTVLLPGLVWATLAGLALLGIRLLTRALDMPEQAVTVSGEPLLPRLGEMTTFLLVLVGALLLSTMALTAALRARRRTIARRRPTAVAHLF